MSIGQIFTLSILYGHRGERRKKEEETEEVHRAGELIDDDKNNNDVPDMKDEDVMNIVS